MKHLYFSFFFCFTSFFIFGQHEKIDSLKSVLEKTKLDTVKIKTYHQLIKAYLTKDIEIAEKYSDSMLKLSKNGKYKRFELTTYSQKGIIKYLKSDFPGAIAVWKKGFRDSKSENHLIQKSNLSNNIAIGYKVLREKDSALNYMLQSLAINKLISNEIGLIASHYTLADYYTSYLDYDNAIIHANELQRIALENNNKSALARAYIVLGNIGRDEYDFIDAAIQFEKASKIYEEIKPINLLLVRATLFESIVSKMKGEQYLDAVNEFILLKKEYGANIKNENFWLHVDAYALNCYNKLNNKEKGSEIYYSLKKTFNRKLKDDGFVVSKKALMAISLSEHELLYNKIDNKTLNRLTYVLPLLKETEDLRLKSSIYKNISNYYNAMGDNRKAYSNLKRHNTINDSINSIKVSTINLSLKRKFNIELKQKENLQLKADRAEQSELLAIESKRKWQLGGGLATALLGLGVFTFYYRRNQNQKTAIENLQKELHHRVKNNLAIIDTFIEVVKDEFNDEKIDTKLTELQNRIDSINEVHKQLYISDNVTDLNLKKYINTIANNVQQSFNISSIDLDQNIDEKLNISPEKSFPIGLIINEFITNSYKYAFSDNKGKIVIKIDTIGNKINLSLSDNGMGLSKDFSIETANTFGIRIMKLLTEQLKGSFNLTNEKGVKLNIEFPK